MNKYFYDSFHAGTKTSFKVITENNFTHRTLLSLLDKYQRNNILDIGCGSGVIDIYLASKGKAVTGLDISKKAISVANKSSRALHFERKLKFINDDFLSHKFNQKYDLVICSEVLEHLPEDKKVIKKIYSLLPLKGIAIFSVPSINAPLYRLGLLKNFDKKVGHLRRYSPDAFIKQLRIEGFAILQFLKTEGVLRNFLFTNVFAGKLIRYINFFVPNLFTKMDNLTMHLFGESNFYVVAKKG